MAMHWIIVADAGRARVLEAGLMLDRFTEVQDLVHPEARLQVSEILTDGRGATGATAGRHARIEPVKTRKEHEAEVFAREVAEAARAGADDGAYERLVLVAPPGFLGVLRASLEDRVAARVIAEIPKDFTRKKAHDLPAALRPHLPEVPPAP